MGDREGPLGGAGGALGAPCLAADQRDCGRPGELPRWAGGPGPELPPHPGRGLAVGSGWRGLAGLSRAAGEGKRLVAWSGVRIPASAPRRKAPGNTGVATLARGWGGPRSPGAGSGSQLRAAPRQSLRADLSLCPPLCGGGTEPSTLLPADGPLPPGGGCRTGRDRPRLGRPRVNGTATPENPAVGSQQRRVRSCWGRGGPARPPLPPQPLSGSHREPPAAEPSAPALGRSGVSFLPAAPGFPSVLPAGARREAEAEPGGCSGSEPVRAAVPPRQPPPCARRGR